MTIFCTLNSTRFRCINGGFRQISQQENSYMIMKWTETLEIIFKKYKCRVALREVEMYTIWGLPRQQERVFARDLDTCMDATCLCHMTVMGSSKGQRQCFTYEEVPLRLFNAQVKPGTECCGLCFYTELWNRHSFFGKGLVKSSESDLWHLLDTIMGWDKSPKLI